MSFLTSKNFDSIIEYCLIEQKNHISFGYMQLWRYRFKNLNPDDIQLMIKEMERIDSDVLNFDLRTHTVVVNSRTQLFFDDGGYSEIEKRKNKNIKKESKKETLETTKLKLEIQSLIAAKKRQKTTNIITYVSLVLSLLLALNEFGFFTFLKNIFK